MAYVMTSECYTAIPVDLNEYDSYVEIAASLEKLEKLFDSVTATVQQRVVKYRNRLGDIEGRINQAALIVQHMQGSGRGYHILSRPTFPKAQQMKGALFPRMRYRDKPSLKAHVKDEESYAGSGKKSDVVTAADLLSALNVPAPNVLDKTQVHHFEELGEMPHSLMYASSILVFHSKANPYHPEVIEASAEVVMAQEEHFQHLPPQPPTLLYGEEAWRMKHFHPLHDYNFQPTPQTVNKMKMPEVLELPNIAVEGSFPEVVKSEWDMTVVPSVVKAKKSDVRKPSDQKSGEAGYDDNRPLPKLPDISRAAATPADSVEPKKMPFSGAESLDLDMSGLSELPDIHSDPRSLKRDLPPKADPERKSRPSQLSPGVREEAEVQDPAERLKGQVALRFSGNIQPLARPAKDDETMSVWTESEI